ncbi:MAG: hypothetical protein OXT67_12990, partial [Zetaproteobacteria bacterium]|nr:hypothetical protein [Zetaproteobacteria bacterium]
PDTSLPPVISADPTLSTSPTMSNTPSPSRLPLPSDPTPSITYLPSPSTSPTRSQSPSSTPVFSNSITPSPSQYATLSPSASISPNTSLSPSEPATPKCEEFVTYNYDEWTDPSNSKTTEYLRRNFHKAYPDGILIPLNQGQQEVVLENPTQLYELQEWLKGKSRIQQLTKNWLAAQLNSDFDLCSRNQEEENKCDSLCTECQAGNSFATQTLTYGTCIDLSVAEVLEQAYNILSGNEEQPYLHISSITTCLESISNRCVNRDLLCDDEKRYTCPCD